MKHPINVEGYASFDELVDDMIRNDYVRIFLEELSDDMKRQGDNDFSDGKTTLAGRLGNASNYLSSAARNMERGRNPGSMKEVTGRVGIMQYDCVARVVGEFAERITEKGLDLWGEDRYRAESLVDAAENLNYAHDELMAAWEICEKYMQPNH